MKINIRLSEGSINNAISKLETARTELENGVCDLVDILLMDGAEIANGSYGGMATAWGQRDSEGNCIATGHIGVTADSPDVAIIAEFGAGDETLPVRFERNPNVSVYPGSYSEIKGSGQYATWRRWYFRHKEYHYVEPRMGLYNAKTYILTNGNDIARQVLRI